MKKGSGKLFVVSSPSGGGKTTVVRRALKKIPSAGVSVSWTTRRPRRGERGGFDYKFVTKKKFRNLIESRGFLEWAEIYGEYYGTPASNIAGARRKNIDLFLIIDVQGGAQVRKRVRDSVLVFIKPPSIAELKNRLKKRGLDTPNEIKRRVREAKKEISKARSYDYIVVNDKLSKAVRDLVGIVNLERKKLAL